jgi:hypothetical protein
VRVLRFVAYWLAQITAAVLIIILFTILNLPALWAGAWVLAVAG